MARNIKAAHIANFILDSAERDGVQDMSILKLLKLVYIFFGWSTVLRPDSEYLFSDPIEAWKYGPVVPSIYYELRGWGELPIGAGSDDRSETRATLYDPEVDEEPKQPSKEDIDELLIPMLDTIWEAYKDAPADHLVSLTHRDGTPWAQAFDGTRNREISKDLIRDYYTRLYESLK